ncbi:MAG: tRNA-splicing ligase RtcB [Planctomycetota bacterium]|jgi:tRNA-splicing ligase RtcB
MKNQDHSNEANENYETFHGSRVPVMAWTRGVEIADNARDQIMRSAQLPIVHSHIAVMPDVHWGLGATIGSVIPTLGAIIPAAVGVDIGCGMMATRTTLTASDLPDNLKPMRSTIERAVPHGRSSGGRKDKGSWWDVPTRAGNLWKEHLNGGFDLLCEKYPALQKTNNLNHLGTLGTGNHFIEVCLDESERVWFMLHSGSRGVGNRIGSMFIEKAKKDMGDLLGNLPDKDLAYLTEGSQHFEDYVEGVLWAQTFASINRQVMMENVIDSISKLKGIPAFKADVQVVNCHHNYVSFETHFDEDCWVTRKGALSARGGELGIIPGSMGAKSFIVRGKGNKDSFHSCSHGAGRVMSRTKAKKLFSTADHAAATAHVECRKDEGVIDETPAAYKDIEAVMKAQSDLVDIEHTLRQVVCVKG